MRSTRLKEDTLKEAMLLIQSLDPRPGQSINTGESEYVIPDVLVRKTQNTWTVELNGDSIPRLKINQQYAALGNNARSEADGQFIRSNLQEAKWLIKSLESRNETLLKVTRCIVSQQQAFFEQGEEFMKPMVLADIAQAVEMHESTIRASPRRSFCTARAAFSIEIFLLQPREYRQRRRSLLDGDPRVGEEIDCGGKPRQTTQRQQAGHPAFRSGIIVARRTVAKYRESLSIPPSNQRKQLV